MGIFSNTVFLRTLIIFITITFLVDFCYSADKKKNSDKPIGVLLTGHTLDKEIGPDFRDRGIHIDTMRGNKLPDLKPYNVIVVTPGGRSGIDGWLEEIRKFLDAGGGVLYCGDFAGPAAEKWYTEGQQIEGLAISKWFREKLGYNGPAGPPFTDPKVASELTPWWKGYGISLTDNIPKSPVSKEVEKVWYPNYFWGRHEWKQTGGMIVSPDWQVVLKANQSATGKRKDAPVLMAIRKYGKGRVAVTPINPMYYFWAGSHPTIRKRVYSDGINNIKSDFHTLLENSIRWLAEPSQKSGKLGGYVYKKKQPWQPKPFNYKKYGNDENLKKWPPKTEKTYRGLIGAQTVLSSGTSTVKQFAEAAEKAGLDFIVILEDFTKMTPAKLKQLEKECRSVSSNKFACLPGMLIPDDTNHTCYYFGRDLAWPPAKCLTEDGKALANRHIIGEKPFRPGMGLLTFVHDNTAVFKRDPKSMPQNFGYCNFTPVKESAPIWDLRVYSSIGLEFTKNGKVIDQPKNLLPDYLRINNDGCGIKPLSISIMTDAGQIKKFLDQGNYLNCVYYPDYLKRHAKRPLDRQLMENLQYHSSGLTTYISNGPVIDGWWANTCTPYNGGWFQPHLVNGKYSPMPNMRDFLAFEVSSPAGLREVILWCNMKVFRRYLPKGEKTFRKVLQCLHEKSRAFVLEVIDNQGKRAITSPLGIGANYAWIMCSDRINGDICHGPFYFNNRNQITAGSKIIYMPPGTDAHFPRAGISISSFPMIYPSKEDGGGRIPYLNQQWQIDLIADHGRMVGVKCFKDYLPDEKVMNGWNTFGPLTKPRFLKMTQMIIEFFPLDSFTTGFARWGNKFVERTAVLDVDIEFIREFKPTRVNLFTIKNPQKDYLLAVVAGKNGDFTACGQPGSFTPGMGPIPFTKDNFFAGIPLNDNAGGGMFILLNDSPMILKRYNKHQLAAFLPKLTTKGIKKGDKINYRFLIIGYSEGTRPANLGYYSGIYRFLGFGRKPGYDLKLDRGKIINQKGVLTLATKDGAVEFKYKNPGHKQQIRMPIMVEGLNDNWTAIIWWFNRQPCPLFPAGIKNGKLPLAIDSDKPAHLMLGHPVIANQKELKIQFIQKFQKPPSYYIHVHNPTDKTITATISKAMDLPGFTFTNQKITLKPGEDWTWETGKKRTAEYRTRNIQPQR